MSQRQMIVAVDFDGTIVEHQYPFIGEPIPGAIDSLKRFIDEGIRLVLWTCRRGDELTEAVVYCANNGVFFEGVNEDISSISNLSGKIYADFYIDDRAMFDPIDWAFISEGILDRNANYLGRRVADTAIE